MPARDLRAAQQIKVKVVADSTLRRAEQVGLCADVLCMSGGGIGHLANAIRDDPDMRERGEACVVTALNDVYLLSRRVFRSCQPRWRRMMINI